MEEERRHGYTQFAQQLGAVQATCNLTLTEVQNQNSRLRKVERKMAWAQGVLAVITFGLVWLGGAVDWAVDKLNRV